MKKIIFLALVFILLFSFSINAQEVKFPVKVIENFQSDGEETLAKLFTYEIKESIRNSKIMDLNKGTGSRLVLFITTLPHNKFSNDTFIFSVSWLMIDNYSDDPPYFIESTLGYTSRDVYEESAKGIFISTEDLISEFM